MKSLGRTVQIFYFTGLLLVMLGFSAVMKFVYDRDLMNIAYIGEYYKSEYIFEDYVTKKSMVDVHEKIMKNNARDAIKEFDEVMLKVQKINEFVVFIDPKFSDSEKELRKSIVKLLAYSNIESVVDVLSKKLGGIEVFVRENNWKTLSNITQNMNDRLSSIKKYDVDYLRSVLQRIVKDRAIVDKVVRTSMLADESKSKIFERFRLLETEITIIENYLADIDTYSNNMKRFEQDFADWKQQVGPGLAEKRAELRQDMNVVLFVYMAMLAGTGLLIVAGLGIYVRSKNKNRTEIENLTVDLIQKNIIAPQMTFDRRSYSETFAHQIQKLHVNVQKRFEFSSVFQASLPIPAVMFDKDLKVVWANVLFCDMFKIANFEGERDLLSWDYLVRFTNLGDEDPLLLALKERISSIHQIKVRPDQKSDALPFEMYTSVVDVSSEPRIICYFYPLASMEETIREQSASVAAPMARVLEVLNDEMSSEDLDGMFSEDFHKVGISDLFLQFKEINQKINQHKYELLQEIARLEDRNNSDLHFVQQLKNHNDLFAHEQSGHYETINKIGSEWSDYLKILMDRHENAKEMRNHFGTLKQRIDILIKEYREFYEKSLKVYKIVGDVKEKKSELMNYGERIDLFNKKTVQNIDKMLVYDQTGSEEVKRLCSCLAKIRSDVLELDEKNAHYIEGVKNVDIALSKAKMYLNLDKFNETDLQNLDAIQGDVKNYAELVSNNKMLVSEIGQNEQNLTHYISDVITAFEKNLNFLKKNGEHLQHFLMSENPLEELAAPSYPAVTSTYSLPEVMN